MTNHKLAESKKYPGGLRFFKCSECDYLLAAEVDRNGAILLDTRIVIKEGDACAAHSIFKTPDIRLDFNVEGS